MGLGRNPQVRLGFVKFWNCRWEAMEHLGRLVSIMSMIGILDKKWHMFELIYRGEAIEVFGNKRFSTEWGMKHANENYGVWRLLLRDGFKKQWIGELENLGVYGQMTEENPSLCGQMFSIQLHRFLWMQALLLLMWWVLLISFGLINDGSLELLTSDILRVRSLFYSLFVCVMCVS